MDSFAHCRCLLNVIFIKTFHNDYKEKKIFLHIRKKEKEHCIQQLELQLGQK